MNLHEWSEAFYQTKRSSNRSPRTLRYYQYNIGRFLSWCAEKTYAESDLAGAVAVDVIEEYLTKLGQDHSPFTVLCAYRSLRALYRYIVRRDGARPDENPFTWVERPSTPALLPKAVPYAELVLLLHSIPVRTWVGQRDRLILKVLFFTGMRLSEISALGVRDVDLEQRQIRIYRSKTTSEALIPISRSLQADLRTWLQGQRPECGHDGLWPASDGTQGILSAPLSAAGLAEMTRRRCRLAGLNPYRPHAFRHGCAAHIIQRGGDLSLVKDLLGHRDIATTQVYLRFDLSRLKSQYDRIFE